MIFSNWDDRNKSDRGPSIDASCQILLYFSKLFQMRICLEIYQPETRIAHGGYVEKRIGTEWYILIEDLP